MPLTLPVAVPKNCIADKVSGYTDLDLTVSTGEYYLDTYPEGTEGINPLQDAFDSFGSLSKEVDQWTELALEDVYRKALAISSRSDVESFYVKSTVSSELFPITMDLISDHYETIARMSLISGEGAVRRAAIRGDFNKIGEYTDGNSIYKASQLTPVWVQTGRSLYAFPQSTTYLYEILHLARPRYSLTVGVRDVAGGDTATMISSLSDHYNELDVLDSDQLTARLPTIWRKPAAFAHTFISRAVGESAVFFTWYVADWDSLEAESLYMLPTNLINAVALKVSSLLLSHRMRSMDKDLPEQVDYAALTSTSIAADTSHGWERVRFYIEEEEDSELSQMLIGGLNAETQAMVLRYGWYGQQKQLVDSLYGDIFMNENLEQKRESGQV